MDIIWPIKNGQTLYHLIVIHTLLLQSIITISYGDALANVDNDSKVTNHTVPFTPVPTTTVIAPNISSLTTEKATILNPTTTTTKTTPTVGNYHQAELNGVARENDIVNDNEHAPNITTTTSSPQKHMQPNNDAYREDNNNELFVVGNLPKNPHETIAADNTPDDVIMANPIRETPGPIVTTAANDFHFDLNRYTSIYNEHPFENLTHTHNLSQINTTDDQKHLNISTDDFKEHFDKLVLTTPSIKFFDDKHKQYETDPMFNHLGDGDTDHHTLKTVAAEEPTIARTVVPEIHLDDIKRNSTDTKHTTLFYNNTEFSNTRYDVATNEIHNGTIDDPGNNATNIVATTEKRGKYLQLPGSDVNLTIPNTAEVWALASMKNVGNEKSKTGQFFNVTTQTGEEHMRNNGTIATKQLADWVEVMKNDVFSNVTFGTNESAIDRLKKAELPQDNVSQENHIVTLTDVMAAAPLPPNPLPAHKDVNFTAETVVSENKIDTPAHQPKIDEGGVGGEFEVDDLAKSKVKPSAENATIVGGTELTRTSTIADIDRNALPHEDDLNVIREIIYPNFAKNFSTTATTPVAAKGTTHLPLVYTTTDEPTTEHRNDKETTIVADMEPTTGIIDHFVTNTFDEHNARGGPVDLSHVITTTLATTTDYDGHQPTTTTDLISTVLPDVDETTTHHDELATKPVDDDHVTAMDDVDHEPIQTSTLEPPLPQTTVKQQTTIAATQTTTTTTNSKDHQAKVDVSTTIINLNRDEYKYSTMVDQNLDAATTTTTTSLHTFTGVKPKNGDKPLIAAIGGDGHHNDANHVEIVPTIDDVTTTDPTGPIDLAEIGGIQSNETDVNAIIATTVSIVGVICLILLVGFLIIMRKRQKQMTYGQRCRPVGLDAYSLDNVSVYNSVRRKGILRASKRSFGNAAFDDPSLKNNLLTMSALATYVQNRNAIYEEFKELPTVTARADEVPPGCESKNRYANVVPLPETRVHLKRLNDDEQSEYINANYVRLPKDPLNYYIACQAPMDQTIVDFWRMIWEQSSRVIVMSTDLIENGIEKCAEYMPSSIVLDNHLTFGDFTVTLRCREVKEKYAVSTLHLKNNVTNTWREITHLWYQWPDTGVPTDEAPLVAMLLEARSYLKMAAPEQTDDSGKGDDATIKENGNVIDKTRSLQRVQGPLTVHCSPGTGRTGTIIACDIAIRALEKPTRSVDIPQIVYYVRRGRASAVLTREQYEFIYKVSHMYATKLTAPMPEN